MPMTDEQYEYTQELDRLQRQQADMLDDHARRVEAAADRMVYAAEKMGSAAGTMYMASR
jgi:hypothetical protein